MKWLDRLIDWIFGREIVCAYSGNMIKWESCVLPQIGDKIVVDGEEHVVGVVK